jgi:NAD(P)-dependent dehydrogenase (short-subunit alcohol dehydrogenase family)
MGRAIALGLAKHGAKIVCCDLKQTANPNGYEADKDIPTADLIVRDGGSAIFCQVDISNAEQVKDGFEKTISVRKPIHKVPKATYSKCRLLGASTSSSIVQDTGPRSETSPMKMTSFGPRWQR